MSTIVKADANGAVTLPAELCRAAGVEPGGTARVDLENGHIRVEPERKPFWQRILDLTDDIPPEELDKLPTDGASQHDHYIYGTPKRPE